MKEVDRYWLAGGSKPIPHLTQAATSFAHAHSKLLDLHIYLLDSRLHQLAPRAGESPESANARINEHAEHAALLDEIVLCRVVDNFLSFVSDLLGLIYSNHPHMLKSSEQERIDYILQFDSMDELRHALVEKKVDKLAYMGLRDLHDHLKKNMQFELFTSQEELQHAALLVEYRNLFAHNRGIVSNISARRFEELRSSVGARVVIPQAELRGLRQFLEQVVIDADIRATIKFNLPAQPVPTPPSHLLG